MPFLALPRE
jgi:hypothetical protein